MYKEYVATFYGSKMNRFWVECALKNMNKNYDLQKHFYKLPRIKNWVPLIVLNMLHGSSCDAEYNYEKVGSLVYYYIGNPEYRQFVMSKYEVREDRLLVYFSAYDNKREFFNEMAKMFNIRVTIRGVKYESVS